MVNGSTCSDTFPSTDVFYAEISDDIAVIVLLALACVLTLGVIVIFIDEHLYLSKVHNNDPVRQRRVITLLGLYPMICVMSLISLLVPASTQLVDLIASCYLSVCIYMFVCLMVEYFGGSEKMVEALADDKIRMNTPPCCCCFVCLPRITLTKKSLYYIELLALQVAIVRPLLLFIAAVLWTDGKYVQGNTQPNSAALYISLISAVSTLLSMYGMIVIFRCSRIRMQQYKLNVKFLALQLMVVLSNVQPLIFGIIGRYALDCIGSRGKKVRASNMNHGVLIIEVFLLSMLARYAYRRPEPEPNAMTKDVESGIQTPAKYKQEEGNDVTEPGTVGKFRSYDNQAMSMDENSLEIKPVGS